MLPIIGLSFGRQHQWLETCYSNRGCRQEDPGQCGAPASTAADRPCGNATAFVSGSPVTLSGTTTVNFLSGMAAFNNLIVPSATYDEILTATLTLKSSLGLNLTAASSSVSSPSTAKHHLHSTPFVRHLRSVTITLSAIGGDSGNPVTFSILSGPGSINENTLNIIGVGTIVIAANQVAMPITPQHHR